MTLRVVMIDGDPWFVAADVCRVLGSYVTSKGGVNVTMALKILNTDEKMSPLNPIGGRRVVVISESGLNKLIMRSDSDERIKVARNDLADDEVTNLPRAEVGEKTRGRDMKLVSESGLNKLIMRSSKPKAKPFQEWVSRDVLPSIRKTGSACPSGQLRGRSKGV